jgi:hypothetical protein
MTTFTLYDYHPIDRDQIQRAFLQIKPCHFLYLINFIFLFIKKCPPLVKILDLSLVLDAIEEDSKRDLDQELRKTAPKSKRPNPKPKILIYFFPFNLDVRELVVALVLVLVLDMVMVYYSVKEEGA